MEYKDLKVRYINGYKVTSRVVKLSPEEEQDRYSEIKTALNNIAEKRKAKIETA